jgi:phenylalanyl-tRNA synthetase beta chain
MKFSYNWIQELVPSLKATPAETMRQITLRTAEAEGIDPVGQHFGKVVSAKVVEVEPIEGTHNRRVVVKSAQYGTRTVVCGAPNVRVGMVAVYCPPGVEIEGKLLEKAIVSGVESDGMLASGKELGINKDHEGIVEVGGGIGCTPDFMIEIDNKSLTHRPDLWGHYGMAREVAAIYGLELKDPVKLRPFPQELACIDVAIKDFNLCPRYSALIFENVRVGPSPLWFQYRLESLGLNPINNIVDVTNYIMAELAQPMHAFDADKVKGGIRVRNAHESESMAALNGDAYQLDSSTLVITDDSGPIAIAGVIGGSETAISDTTTRIILESANFQAASIRKTSTRLKLRTDASMRFEKSQDPLNTVRALARAVSLLQLVNPGIRVVGGLADVHAEFRHPAPIVLPLDWLGRKLGNEITAAIATKILTRLQFGVSDLGDGTLEVRVPSWRATKDISIKEDLVEEIGRMIGYDNFTPVAPLVAAAPPPANASRAFQHQLRTVCSQQGYTEVYNYSFVNAEQAAKFGLSAESHVRVLNPIASDQGLLRRSLLPGIHRNLVENAKHSTAFKLFEIGYEIHPVKGQAPLEIPQLVAAVYSRQDGEGNLQELKRLIACLNPAITIKPTAALAYEHPGRVAEVWLGETSIGRLFELHPSLVKGRAAIADLNLDLLQLEKKQYHPVRKFPSSDFDLSVVAGPRVLVSTVAELLSGPLVERTEYLMLHPLGEGRNSISFRITLAAPDHTLSAGEISSTRERLIGRLREAGLELR